MTIITKKQVDDACNAVENNLKIVRELQAQYFRGPTRKAWQAIQLESYGENQLWELVSDSTKTRYYEIKASFVELEERYESAKIRYSNLAERANKIIIQYCKQEGFPSPRMRNI